MHCFSIADEIISSDPMEIIEQKFDLHETVNLEYHQWQSDIGESSNNKPQGV